MPRTPSDRSVSEPPREGSAPPGRDRQAVAPDARPSSPRDGDEPRSDEIMDEPGYGHGV